MVVVAGVAAEARVVSVVTDTAEKAVDALEIARTGLSDRMRTDLPGATAVAVALAAPSVACVVEEGAVMALPQS